MTTLSERLDRFNVAEEDAEHAIKDKHVKSGSGSGSRRYGRGMLLAEVPKVGQTVKNSLPNYALTTRASASLTQCRALR